jgi:hypothetical protein
MTEDEAKTKWCPHARVLDGSPPGGAGVNRKGPEAGVYCIASTKWTQEEMDAADLMAQERFERLKPLFEADNGPVESGPALKCPNPDCEDGQIHMYADQIIDCPTCHGTGEKP